MKKFRWASMRRPERGGSTLMDRRSVCVANRVRFMERSIEKHACTHPYKPFSLNM